VTVDWFHGVGSRDTKPTSDFLAINRFGKIPVLIDDDELTISEVQWPLQPTTITKGIDLMYILWV
jgi:hypothetical protein